MKKVFKILVGFELVVLTCLVCLPGGNNARARPSDTGTNPPEREIVSRPLSTNVTEVIRLAESAIEEEVILAYIESSQTPFGLSADDIIYVKDLGISPEIITAILHRDAVLREQGIQPGADSTNQFVYEQKLYQPETNAPPGAPPPAYATNAPPQVAYFYDTLRPYGTWIDLEGAGWCWQPAAAVVDPYWRPYWQGGGWMYSDSGWYWYSDYSWGWAPFHYGRWHRHQRHGWLWFPELVWGPAWVSWRFSDAHCGWAPLPPGAEFVIGHGWRFNNVSVGVNFDFHLGPDLFAFVELRHLRERHPHLHAIPAAQAKEVHRQTTVANNYVVGPNHRIINQGVAPDRVAAASGREIQPVTIKEVPAPSSGAIGRDRIGKEGLAPVLYRPELKGSANPGSLTAQKVDERHAILRPMPQRPSIPVPRGPAAGVRPVPSASVLPEPAKRPAPTPVAPRSAPTKPLQPPTGGVPRQPVQPAVPPHTPPPPPRSETPKGREQRLSNGPQMQRPSPPPATPPSSRPPAQRGTERRPPTSSGVKHN